MLRLPLIGSFVKLNFCFSCHLLKLAAAGFCDLRCNPLMELSLAAMEV